MIGWAKPTPVDLRNLRNRPMDEILIALAGPLSNLVIAIACLPMMFAAVHASAAGKSVVGVLARENKLVDAGVMSPIILILYLMMIVNVWLAIFNLIPIPPLDGSKVLRHFMPESVRDGYDRFGFVGLILLVAVGGRFLNFIISPVVNGLKALMQVM
jgi:Zn-dependent protease